MTLEAIHALERIWLTLVLAELRDPEVEQTGSAGELAEHRKRCFEYVLEWDRSANFSHLLGTCPSRACLPQWVPRQMPEEGVRFAEKRDLLPRLS